MDQIPQAPPNGPNQNYSYGKKSIGRWIVIYLILAAIIYGLVYAFFFYNKNGGNNYSSQTQNTGAEQNQTTKNYMVQNMNIEVLQEGTGIEAKNDDTVTVNYTGMLVDGTKFDSSLNPGRTPFSFTIGPNCAINNTCVIKGWDLGVTGMKVGGKRKLTIPGDLAYGPQGRPPVIPANATLIFDIELLKIN